MKLYDNNNKQYKFIKYEYTVYDKIYNRAH